MQLDRITVEPGKLGGKPCIRGLRISVSFVLKMLASRMTAEQILHDHPDLEAADIDQCLEYASLMTDEQNFPLPALAS